MPKVVVWKCPHTGKLFEDPKKYRSHLARLAGQRREQRKQDLFKLAKQQKWNEICNIEMSVTDLEKFIIDNQELFWRDAIEDNPYEWKDLGKKVGGVVMPIPRLIRFKQFTLKWSDKTSNTHYCPKNGVTNWRWEEDKPRGYPGWHGSFEWECEWPKELGGRYQPGDLFDGKDCRIHTGSGGGGGMKDNIMSHRYEITIFADDWPGLARYREKEEMWRILNA